MYSKAELKIDDSKAHRMFHAAMKKAGMSDAQEKAFIKERYDAESSDDLSFRDKMDAIEEVLGIKLAAENAGKPFPTSDYGARYRKDPKTGKWVLWK
jgi:hypothetical protein